MAHAPRVLVMRAPGTNCDRETAFACELAGATTSTHTLLEVRQRPALLREHQILVLPGGFSYGDDAGAGAIWAAELRHFLADELRAFRDRGKLILGICNGFQALVRTGLLVPPDEDGPLISLTRNTQGRYIDRWVQIAVQPGNCQFLTGLETLRLPMAHGEGRFVARENWHLEGLEQAGQLVLRYATAEGRPTEEDDSENNPNGSQRAVAGLTDLTGQVLGLMPHPERHCLPTQHPQWTRLGLSAQPDGLKIFQNAVNSFA
ncbi:MAG: phosphoribosylformylglycinamidine synthase I [Planctomycetota bacterium]|nr:phosphoribosylformylglycinamidine synthase I [Planctomycetota bacterium]